MNSYINMAHPMDDFGNELSTESVGTLGMAQFILFLVDCILYDTFYAQS